MNKEKKEKLRGDKLRELIFWVYLHNKFEKEKLRMSILEKEAGYQSPGGLYSAINYSGYFDKENDEITLSRKGLDYLNKQIMPIYQVLRIFGNFLIILGLIFLCQWYYWTYQRNPLVIPWYSAIVTIGVGVFMSVFFLKINYWTMRYNRRS